MRQQKYQDGNIIFFTETCLQEQLKHLSTQLSDYTGRQRQRGNSKGGGLLTTGVIRTCHREGYTSTPGILTCWL